MEILPLLIETARNAGDAILKIYAQDFEVAFKSDHSPLTKADEAAHQIIVAALSTTPYPILSEESAEITFEKREDWKRYWLVDPLDGTKEFIKKNGEFTVNIALIDEGRPVMGLVYAPVLDVLYFGSVENGTSEAWKTLDCRLKSVGEIISSAQSLIGAKASLENRSLQVVASKSHCNDETHSFIEALENAFGSVERVSKGSSLKLCMVAEGTADIYPRIAPTMEWDTAAAHAVVRAAGGEVFEYNSSILPPEYLNFDPERTRDGWTPLRYNKENLLNPYFVVV